MSEGGSNERGREEENYREGGMDEEKRKTVEIMEECRACERTKTA